MPSPLVRVVCATPWAGFAMLTVASGTRPPLESFTVPITDPLLWANTAPAKIAIVSRLTTDLVGFISMTPFVSLPKHRPFQPTGQPCEDQFSSMVRAGMLCDVAYAL